MAASITNFDEFRYDVFLSFRGADTRTNFTDHLYMALKNAGVETFRDDDEIRRCENIKSELQRAIKQSKMSVIVFSEDYTCSKACLEEVKTIFQRNKASKKHDILPVFYHVEPEQLKKKARELAAAQPEKEEYSKALKEVASIAGMLLKRQQYESIFIEEIVEMVQGKLMPKVIPLSSHLVGMESKAKKINLWLRSTDERRNDNVDMLVICGMGGLGKTTTAKYIYNSTYAQFDGSSFLSNIQKASKNPKGLVSLQRQLLFDIQKKPERKIYTIDDGIRRIQYVLKNKRILLVLDDVDDVDQLEAIIGTRNWFTLGSKVIITTRREDLLKAHENYEIHRIEKLNDEESLELFSMYAFGETHPVEGFVEHSKIFVSHCQGLPLALQVLGSSVSGMSLEIWNRTLANLELSPETQIFKKLKISFDSLNNKKDQDLFLDIACFFVGSDKNNTITILEGCDYYAALGIQKLVNRNLLSVGKKNKLEMHQLIQDMGRQIVSEESRRPEERTRLWNHKESFKILRKKTGSANVEGLILDMKMLKKKKDSTTNIRYHPMSFLYRIYPLQTDQDDEELVDMESFKGMHNLRLLKLDYVKLCGRYVHLPRDLRLLCLHGFHLKYLPNGFLLENIVSLDLRYSNLKEVLSKETKVLETLKILNLSHCHQLVKTPNFSTTPNLEKLMLKDCPSLYVIHESIVFLETLTLLNLKDCKSLKKLPRNLYLVKSLEQLIISGCSNLVGAAVELSKMDSLKELFADRMELNQILVSTPHEVALTYLLPWLTITKPMKNPETSYVCLPRSLVTLSLVDSNLTDDSFPNEFGDLPMLEILDLRQNQFRRLPQFVKKLGRELQKLNVSWCSRLEEVEMPKVNVKELIISECRALQRVTYETVVVPPKFIEHACCLSLNYIEGAFKIDIMNNVDALVLENIGFCDFEIDKSDEVHIINVSVWSGKKLPVQIMYEGYIFNTYFHGNEVPSCFTIKSTCSNVLSFIVPSTSSPKVRGLNMCLVYTLPTDISWTKDHISVTIRNKSKDDHDYTHAPRCYGVQDTDENLTWISHWLWDFWGDLFEEGDEAEVCFNMNGDAVMKDCGINFLYYNEGGIQQYYKALTSLWHSGRDLIELLQIGIFKHPDEISDLLQLSRYGGQAEELENDYVNDVESRT